MYPAADRTSLARDGLRLEDLLCRLAPHHAANVAHRAGDLPGPSWPHERNKPRTTDRYISQGYSGKLRLTPMPVGPVPHRRDGSESAEHRERSTCRFTDGAVDLGSAARTGRQSDHDGMGSPRESQDRYRMTTKPKPKHRIVSKLLDSRSHNGEFVTACVCANDSGTQWLRIERRSRDGHDCSVNLPLRLAGLLGETLVQLADRDGSGQ
jgi:hypothetical protein